jgi:hypothetical protein
MRAHEIIQSYIDPNKIRRDMYDEIVDALERASAVPRTAAFLELMYADERDELEIRQLRLDLKRTQAEVGNLEAEAARDRAAVRCELANVENDDAIDSR